MIIRRYLFRQLLQLTLVILFILTLIFLGQQAMRFLNAAIAGKVSGAMLLLVVWYELPHLLGLLLPLALFLSIILCYGRLYSDSELVVLHAAGFSRGQLLMLTWQLALLMFAINCVLSLWLTPMALAQRDSLLNQVGVQAMLAALLPGRFQTPDDKTVIYVRQLSKNKQVMQDVFIAKKASDGSNQWHIITAAQGKKITYRGQPYIQLQAGVRYRGRPGQADFEILKFDDYHMKVGKAQTHIMYHDADTLSTPALLAKRGVGDHRVTAEIQWRFAMPLSIFALTWLATGLSHCRPRQGRFSKILPAVLIYSVYANCMFLSRAWLQKDSVSPWLGVWWVQVALVFLAGLLWYRDKLTMVWSLPKKVLRS